MFKSNKKRYENISILLWYAYSFILLFFVCNNYSHFIVPFSGNVLLLSWTKETVF